MQKTALLIALVAGLGMSHAHASGFYLYGEAGYTDMGSSDAKQEIQALEQYGSDSTDAANEQLATAPGYTADLVYTSDDDHDDRDVSLGLGLGYQVHQNVAIEIGYRDLGEASYRYDYEVTGTDASGTGFRENSYDSSAILLRGVANLPVTERFALEALLGVAYVETDYATGGVDDGDGLLINKDTRERFDDSGYTATYGIGASYAVTTALTGYARLERIHDIDTADRFDGIEADTLSAGIRYHF